MAIAVITRIAAGNAIAIDFIGKWSYYNTLFQQKWAYFVIKYFFKRKALNDLLAWHNSSTRKPLVIRGARQVGKTSLVRSFATKIKCRFMELNLERPSHASIFKSGMSVNEVVDRALLECRTPTGDDPLLLFIDEIQEVPEAVAMLRFFYEERPDIHLIAAGSLLEVALSAAAISFPVGRVEFLYMRPMNFAEFLHAAGDSSLRDALHTIPAPLYAHDLLLKRFNQYALIGGMPEAVTRYVSTGGNLDAVNQVYADLFTAFRDDIPNTDAMKPCAVFCCILLRVHPTKLAHGLPFRALEVLTIVRAKQVRHYAHWSVPCYWNLFTRLLLWMYHLCRTSAKLPGFTFWMWDWQTIRQVYRVTW